LCIQVLLSYGAATDTLDGAAFFASTSISYTDNMNAFFSLSLAIGLSFVGAVQDTTWQDTTIFVELAQDSGCSVTSITIIRSTDDTLKKLDQAYLDATQSFFLIAQNASTLRVVQQLPASKVTDRVSWISLDGALLLHEQSHSEFRLPLFSLLKLL